MTNKERLISLIGFSPAINAAEGALLDNALDPTALYVPANINTVKKSAIEVMSALITTADTGNSITGFNSKYDRAAILKLIDQFKDDILGLGTIGSNKIIKGISPW